MDLYTIDGEIIETPIELEHGNTYVAVIPPDQFIQTDYHTYLMKASRSWQKRQKHKMQVNNESTQDDSHVEAAKNAIMQSNNTSNSTLGRTIETDNNKLGVHEISSNEINLNMKSKEHSSQNIPASFNKNLTNESNIIINSRQMSKDEHTKREISNIIRKTNSITPSEKNLKHSVQNVLTPPKLAVLKTKIPLKRDSLLKDKKYISKLKTNDNIKNKRNKSSSTQLSAENLIPKQKSESINTQNSHFLSLVGMVTQDYALKPSVNTERKVCCNTNETLRKESQLNSQQNDINDIYIRQGANVNFRVFIRVNDNLVPNDTNNNFKLKIIPSNSLLVTEKASQVNIDLDINVATLDNLHKGTGELNSNNVFICTIDNQPNCCNTTVKSQNSEKTLSLLPPEKDDEKLEIICECEYESTKNEQNRPQATSVQSVRNFTSMDKSQATFATDPKQNELKEKPDTVDKFTQTEWNETLLEARYHEDGHYSLHLPTLEMLKSLWQLENKQQEKCCDTI